MVISRRSTRVNNVFKKEPNLSFVSAKIQQNCTDTGNDNSEATRQRINCVQYPCYNTIIKFEDVKITMIQ